MISSLFKSLRTCWRQTPPSVAELELEIRRRENRPMRFTWVGKEEGEPVGPKLETNLFPPISTAREQAPHLIAGRLTEAVLVEGLEANAYRLLDIEWRGDMQTAVFQPVWVEK